MGLPQLSASPPAPNPFQTAKITAQSVRPSILHCKPTLNLLSFAHLHHAGDAGEGH
jgi:hypothetical protein